MRTCACAAWDGTFQEEAQERHFLNVPLASGRVRPGSGPDPITSGPSAEAGARWSHSSPFAGEATPRPLFFERAISYGYQLSTFLAQLEAVIGDTGQQDVGSVAVQAEDLAD